MNLDLVLEDIRQAGKLKVSQITHSAIQQVEELESDAAAEANQAKDRILNEGQIDLNRKKAIILQKTEIQKLLTLEDARQTLIQDVMERVSRKIADYRKNTAYIHTLDQLINETIQAIKPSLLQGQKIILHCDKQDELEVNEMIANKTETIQVVFDLDHLHGCVGETSDQKIVVRNTLESRFERTRHEIYQYLSLYFDQRIKPS